MKKFLSVLFVFVLALACVACDNTPNVSEGENNSVADNSNVSTEAGDESVTDNSEEEVKVMTYAEFVAAELDTLVCVETYVQAKQSWWENKGTFYTQNEEGAYFLYDMPCTEEEYNALTVGTKIRVTGYKAEWSGEVEITEAKFEILEGSYVAEATDVTDLLGTDELIEKQNMFVSFNDLTIEKIEYKNGEAGDDIYVTVSKDGTEYSFCVERYLTAPDTDVYKAFAELTQGDVVDIEGFLYWYNGVNTHITSVAKN